MAKTRWTVSARRQRCVMAQSKACLLLGPWSTAIMMSRPLLLSPVSLSSSGSGTTGMSDGNTTSRQLYSSSSINVSILTVWCCKISWWMNLAKYHEKGKFSLNHVDEGFRFGDWILCGMDRFGWKTVYVSNCSLWILFWSMSCFLFRFYSSSNWKSYTVTAAPLDFSRRFSFILLDYFYTWSLGDS